MTPEEAEAELARLYSISPEVTAMADIVSATLENPALPMLVRAAACVRVGTVALAGLHDLVKTDGADVLGMVHRADLLVLIRDTLRAGVAIADDLVERQPKGGKLDG